MQLHPKELSVNELYQLGKRQAQLSQLYEVPECALGSNCLRVAYLAGYNKGKDLEPTSQMTYKMLNIWEIIQEDIKL